MEPLVYEISCADSDVTLTILEEDMTVQVAPGQDRPIFRKAILKLNKNKLLSMKPIPGRNARTFWDSLLNGHWKQRQGNQNNVTERVMSLDAVLILLSIAHNTVIDEHYKVQVTEMWHLAALCDRWCVDHPILYKWFGNWYENMPPPKSLDDHRKLLWPTWYLNHAQGFMKSSRYVVYHSAGSAQELTPTNLPRELQRWHLDPRVSRKLSST